MRLSFTVAVSLILWSCSGQGGLPCPDGGGAASTGGKGKASTTSGGGTSSSSSGSNSGGAPTSGTTGSTGTASTGGSGTTGGSTGATGTGTTGGSGGLDAGIACAPNSAWMGDVCVAQACPGALQGEACLLPDGGLGNCYGGGCEQLDLTSDPSNCGSYGLACPSGTACVAGACLASPTAGVTCDGGELCPAPDQLCVAGLGCVWRLCDYLVDDEICQVSPGFPTGTCCGGSCLYVQGSGSFADDLNCGGCNVACPAGTYCNDGVCQAFASCTEPIEQATCELADGGFGSCCAGSCVDPAHDPLNCGRCGQFCATGAACTGGACTNADGGPALCAVQGCPPDTACNGNACTPTDCTPPAPDGLPCLDDDAGIVGACCGGACSSLDDPNNCGTCGNHCPTGTACVEFECLAESCNGDGGGCVRDGGRGGLCCGNDCVDTTTDTQNCGGCGRACVPGGRCLDGVFCASVACSSTQPCPTGYECASGSCVAVDCSEPTSWLGCAFDAGSSLERGYCCGTACSSLQSDALNCGTCGRACPTGQSCTSYVCSGAVCDGGSCPTCADAGCPGGDACVGGACVLSTCAAGGDGDVCAFSPSVQGICCGGACVDDQADPSHCGRCGTTCGAGTFCYFGGCAPSVPTTDCLQSCAPGTACYLGGCVSGACTVASVRCAAEDGALGLCCPDGACADVLSDPANCGFCGNACAPGQSCSGGSCA